MIAHAKRAHLTLSTTVKKTVIIGGEEDFCAERCGYKQDKSGIEAYFAPVPVTPSYMVYKVKFADFLPALGFTIVINGYGQFYKWNTTEFTTLKAYGVLSSSKPIIASCVVDDKISYAVFSNNRMGIFNPDGHTTAYTDNRVLCGAWHYGRIFARDYNDPYLLRWSSYDVKDWTEGADKGGRIRLAPLGGEVCNILSQDEKLLIVRRYGISVMRALGDARHFRLEPDVSVSLPSVIDNTSVICRGQLYVFTKNGLFCIDGQTVREAPLGVCGNGFTATAARAYDDRYIYIDGVCGGVNTLLEYDVTTGNCTRFADGCSLLFYTDEGLYCFRDTTLCQLEKGVADVNRKWVSAPFRFAAGKGAALRRITFEGEGGSALTVNCGGRVRRVESYGTHRIDETAESFTFEVNGTGKVSRLVAEWEERK
ncbi:MAG: hypothetical protein HFJ81_03225 [Clostridia bacterium]|nr:hypothetical protein [Clostridia bacterium]